MKKFTSLLFKLALITLLILSPAFAGKIMAQTQPPVGAPVIMLTIDPTVTPTTSPSDQMRMKAATANTPVWIQTATNTYIQTTAGTDFPTNYSNYTPTGTSLNVYGNITGFDCGGSYNVPNPISAINTSGNTGLQELICDNNQLTSLNVRGLTQLEYLNCHSNSLTSLDLEGLTQLQSIRCYNNLLTSLDLEGLTKLQWIWCYNNLLTSLNLEGLTQLQYLNCSINRLSNLNLKGLSSLRELFCSNNRLQNLDLQGINNLFNLNCDNNLLTSLDLQGLTQLQCIWCSNNQLTSINLEGLSQLEYLDCSSNRLTSLNIQGLNQLFGLACYDNPCTSTTLGLDQIYCQLPKAALTDEAKIYVSGKIIVDLEDFVLATNGTNAKKRNWRLFSRDEYSQNYIPNTTGNYVCESCVEIPESNVLIYPNPANHIINIKCDTAIESLELYDISGRLVLSQAGVSAIESSIDVSSLASGIYTLKLRTANGNNEYKVAIGN